MTWGDSKSPTDYEGASNAPSIHCEQWLFDCEGSGSLRLSSRPPGCLPLVPPISPVHAPAGAVAAYANLPGQVGPMYQNNTSLFFFCI